MGVAFLMLEPDDAPLLVSGCVTKSLSCQCFKLLGLVDRIDVGGASFCVP